MSLDASRRPHLAARIATSLALTAIAAAVLACTPPRDTTPTPQSTIAVTAVLSAA
jgi:hypothetical protein